MGATGVEPGVGTNPCDVTTGVGTGVDTRDAGLGAGVGLQALEVNASIPAAAVLTLPATAFLTRPLEGSVDIMVVVFTAAMRAYCHQRE